MQKLIIKKTEETPEIVLNPEINSFQFVATSWPEDAREFYAPILQWIKDYFENSPLKCTTFQFKLEYMNTSSSKQIAKLLSLLKQYSQKHEIKIKWFFEKGDLDMNKEGHRFAHILNMDIEIIES